jgi:8-oxo-dGTP pyrophosphatase MutT (NUDIX family)
VYSPFAPILTTAFFTLEEASPIHPDIRHPYYRITGQDSVICCVLDQADHFVMVRQYRPNLGIETLETPAGGLEKAETPLQAAQREIAEETGLRCALLPLGKTFSLMMNRTNIQDHLFFGMFPQPISDFVPESGVEVLHLPRRELLHCAIQGDYRQLAGLGLLQVAGGLLQVDMWHSPLEAIELAFRQQPQVHWPDHG